MGEVAVWLALRGLDSLDYSYRTDATEYLRDEMGALARLVNNSDFLMLQRDSINTNLFAEMRELAYAVEDMFDNLLPRRRGYKKLIPPSLVLFPRRTQIRRFANKVRDIRVRVEEYYKRSINSRRYGLDIIRTTTPPPPPPPHVGLVGLDHHVSFICQQVLLATCCEWPPVACIVGMAGIGKTTLAGLVFDNLEIKQTFEVLAWMSFNSDAKKSPRFKMITGSSEHEEVLEDDDGLIEKVHDLLQGRHYLIVLDHVDHSTPELEQLKDKALLPAVKGSCVLITTRSMAIAQRYAYPSTPPYQLPLLNQEQSRELLQRYMGGSGGGEEDCSKDVESVHTLLKICGGLPLALNKAGVMLHNKIISSKPPGRTYQEILKELETVPANNIIMDELLEFCLDTVLLRTTYFHDKRYIFVPSFYKRACYLYLASICKDGRIVEASKLIRLWVAEGFIPSYDFYSLGHYSVDSSMEDTARDLLDLLLHFSMIQPVYQEMTDLRRRSSRDFSLTIHPIYHDLCVRENNRDDKRLLDAIAGNSATLNDLPHINNPRRLVLYDLSSSAKLIKTYRNFFFDRRVLLRVQDHVLMDTTTDATADNIDVTTLRSLLIASTKVAPNHLDLKPISWLKYLRVIDLVGVRGLSELPDDIGGIITLRYLGLRRCSILTKLPSSVGALPYLQTLDIRETGIQQLPKTLGARLRHLLAPDSDIGGVDISNLFILDTLAVDDCEGWLLKNLRGWVTNYNIRSLSLKGLGRLTETPWDELAGKLGKLKKMENLYLHAKDPIKILTLYKHLSQLNDKLRELYLNGPMTQELIDGEYCIFPHFDHITVLILDGSKLMLDPMSALGQLESLEHLTLKNDAYIGMDMIRASRGGFPSLKRLELWCLRELKGWIMDQPTLSNLNFLSVGMCESLSDLPEDLQYSMASLREVEVIDPRDEFLDKLRHGWKDWNKINMHALSIKLWRDRS